MDIETYERREEMFAVRAKVLAAEAERIRSGESYTVDEARNLNI